MDKIGQVVIFFHKGDFSRHDDIYLCDYVMDNQVKIKIASYCAYQERTQAEVRAKLKTLGVWGDEAEELIAFLITENYLNEERFAKIYAGSKFRVNRWGRRKILAALKTKGLSAYCVQAGMQEIDPDAYWEALCGEIEKRSKENTLTEKQRVFRALTAKGFESDLILSAWQEVWSSQ